MALEPGYVFAGKYRIEKLLGEGGMGAVYAARHLELEGRVALKVMLDEESSSDAFARFQREARAASQLRGIHIVQTLDAGRLDDGTPFIVLEYVDGVDLDQVLTERGPLPIEEAVDLIVQACEGVAEAHARGMVHRDLKPRNMLLTTRADGSPLLKIVDFGVVKIQRTNPADSITSTSITLTQADAFIGSAHYMAPEQMQMSSKVDARADVWSLGVCLYRLLTGERPFEGESIMEIISATLGRHPKPVDEIRPEIPAAIARAVDQALEKRLQRRFQNVAELAGAIAPAIGDKRAFERIDAVLRGGRSKPSSDERTVTAELDTTVPLATPAIAPVSSGATVPLPSRPLAIDVAPAPPVLTHSRRSLIAIAGAGVVVVLAIITLVVVRSSTDTTTPVTEPTISASPSIAVSEVATVSSPMPSSNASAVASTSPSSWIARPNRPLPPTTTKPKTLPPRPSSSVSPYDQF